MEVRSALFRGVTQRNMVVWHRGFGQPNSPNLTGEDGDRYDPKRCCGSTILRWVKSQKRADLIYTVAEA